MKRKLPSIAQRFWAKGTTPETAIEVIGGRIVVPGLAKTDKGIATLINRAVAKGTIRVEPKS